MQSIHKAVAVKYLGPTNSRGARVKASAGGTQGNVTLPFRHDLSMEQNVAAAVDELLLRYEWDNPYVLGALADGTYVAVLSDPSTYLSTSRNEEKQND
mgnify:CR=1 FL=1